MGIYSASRERVPPAPPGRNVTVSPECRKWGRGEECLAEPDRIGGLLRGSREAAVQPPLPNVIQFFVGMKLPLEESNCEPSRFGLRSFARTNEAHAASSRRPPRRFRRKGDCPCSIPVTPWSSCQRGLATQMRLRPPSNPRLASRRDVDQRLRILETLEIDPPASFVGLQIARINQATSMPR